METGVEQRFGKAERFQSFDIVANVHALRNDLDIYGFVLPQTRGQVANEQLSYFAEGMDKAARTGFTIDLIDNELCYFDDGKWRTCRDMHEAGLEAAKHDAKIDERRAFLVEWAKSYKYHFSKIEELNPGEHHLWVNPYPHDIEKKYGPEFVRENGLSPDRKLGFLYQATRQGDGSIWLETQTLDKSDKDALLSMMDAYEADPTLTMDEAMQTYDTILSQKYGTNFYAGRNNSERHENAWAMINKNKDLTDYLLTGLETIARKAITGKELEHATKRHIYGVWALMKKRIDGEATPIIMPSDAVGYAIAKINLASDVERAFFEFARSGKILNACGGKIVIDLEETVLNASSRDVHEAIFKDDKPEVMKCVTCPLCHSQGVDARIEYKKDSKVITCSKCKKSKEYKKNARSLRSTKTSWFYRIFMPNNSKM